MPASQGLKAGTSVFGAAPTEAGQLSAWPALRLAPHWAISSAAGAPIAVALLADGVDLMPKFPAGDEPQRTLSRYRRGGTGGGGRGGARR